MNSSSPGPSPDVASPGAPAPPGRARPRGRRVLRLVAILTALGLLSGGAALYWRRAAVDPDRLWEHALAQFQAGRFGPAEVALTRLAGLRPSRPQDWLLRAQVDLALGRPEAALEALSHITDDAPEAAKVRLEAGQIEARRHRLKSAEAQLLRALVLDPGLAQARRELVYIYGIQLRRRELADQLGELAYRGTLSAREAWLWCMAADLIWWEPEEIVGPLRLCLEAEPGDRPTRLALAEVLRRQGRRAESEALLAPLPASDPEALALKAQLAIDRGESPAAEALLAGAPEGHPALARLRGLLALADGDARAAVRHFRALAAAAPDRRETAFDLGRALQAAGAEAEARPWLQRARKLDDLAALLLHAERAEAGPALLRELGAACEAVGRRREAKAWYRLAIARDPLDSEAQRALFRLGQPVPDSTPPP